jgi:glycosyltransferase involved in cell wall biosynthesis
MSSRSVDIPAETYRRRTALNIGVDATCWQNNRGYGRHIRALLGALAQIDRQNRYTLFVDSPELIETIPENFAVVPLSPSKPTSQAAAANGRRSLADMWRMSRAISAGRFDLVIYPTIYSYVPVLTRARKLVFIHDVIAETYPQLTLPSPAARLFWNLKVGLGRRQADALVTVSEYSRRRIVEHFRVAADRVFVVGEAGDPVFRRLDNAVLTRKLASLGIQAGKRTVLYVGGFSPHKNIDMVVRAFAACAAQPRFEDIQLVMVGEHRKEVFHSHYSSIASLVRELRLEERTIFTGYLADGDLAVLLNLATVLALPSMMEGFGLPAIEAAACGCPVIATVESPLPELLGDGGVFIPPQQSEMNRTLEMVLDSEPLRLRMREAGLRSTAKLTWAAAARQMLQVIGDVSAR